MKIEQVILYNLVMFRSLELFDVPDFYCEGKIPRVLLFSSTRRKI